jgi:hypothetical protein
MSVKNLNRRGRTVLLHVATVIIAGTLWAGHDAVQAQQRTLAPQSPAEYVAAMALPDLEKAFWACDYAATTRGIYATPVQFCAAVMENLKESKFGGSFEDLLAWWRTNKPAEHEALAQLGATRDGAE